MRILLSIVLAMAMVKISGNSDLLVRALRTVANDLPVILEQAQRSADRR